MSVHRSKIGAEIVLPVAVVMIGTAAVFTVNGEWTGLIMIAAASALVAAIMTGIRYRIDGTTLRISCGPFYRVEIPVHSITSISQTRNPISAPAASLDRWEVRYGKGESVLISPREHEPLLLELLRINPSISAETLRQSFSVPKVK